ncbi:polysaccharide pyruvyl transferase family protein [Brachybacterium sp. AOP29-B2-41]|uniref:polysaccharide pyruvyl transferase family protein n=1 Tax=Brachybacterium sp. AOP29-B2-41 TaxID=3457704 RepID=UPI004034BF17
MKVALLCDVDQTVYHVGDEAIATMSARRLTARGHQVVRLSRHEKYGPGGAAPASSIPALTFPWPLEDRARYLAEIRRALAGDPGALPAADKLFTIIDQLKDVDSVVIGGGGSLTSRYGWLLDERLATALVARSLGKPVVLTGQSLGPELTPADRESMRELLELCTLVGLRDTHSVRIARELCRAHPALVQTLDDAVGLGLSAAAGAHDLDPELLSVTLGGDGDPLPRDAYIALACAVIEELAGRTGARVELVPHMADPDDGGGDLLLHHEVAAQLSMPATVLPIEQDTAAAARTTGAAWVISTRFHPVVFGTAAGSSVLALPLNRYGHSRMDGALRNIGLAGAAVPAAALWDPVAQGPSDLVGPVVEALVAGREAEHATLEAARPQLLAAAESWWDRVAAALAGEEHSASEHTDPVGAGLTPEQRWREPLRSALAPFTRAVDRAGEPSAAIIMRTRDRPQMLDRAVQDVLAQTRQDWELVIVDDAGDRAAVDAVAARHASEADGRLRVIHREASTGMEAASNHGLRETSAPAVVIHDDDDTWHATFLQETLGHLEAHPEQEAVVVRTLIVHEHETPTGFVEDEMFLSWPELEGVRLVDYIAVNRNVPISMLHRRRVHDIVGPYDESLPVVGDYAFHLQLLQSAEVGFLDRPLAQWRQRPAAVGASSNSMYALSGGHRHYDAELRERYFRPWVAEHGIGLPMFLSKNTETVVERSEERLLEELKALREEVAQLHERLDGIAPGSAGQGAAGRAAGFVRRAGRRALGGVARRERPSRGD